MYREIVDSIGDIEIQTVRYMIEDMRIMHVFCRIEVRELEVGSVEEDILMNEVRGKGTEYGKVLGFGRNVNRIAIKALIKMISGAEGERYIGLGKAVVTVVT